MANQKIDMFRFIEELQTRPEIYNPKHPRYHTHKKEKIQEMATLFNVESKNYYNLFFKILNYLGMI